MKRPVSVVMVGEVDHGKSSVLGKLLAATGAVPQPRIEQIQSQCDDQDGFLGMFL